jgi:hypothetical protein
MDWLIPTRKVKKNAHIERGLLISLVDGLKKLFVSCKSPMSQNREYLDLTRAAGTSDWCKFDKWEQSHHQNSKERASRARSAHFPCGWLKKLFVS